MSESPSLEVQLSEALRARDLEEAELLLELGVPPTYQDLEIAIEQNMPEAVELLIAHSVPLDEAGRFVENSLVFCIVVHARWEEKKAARMNDALTIARLLLSHGARVNMAAGFSMKLPIQLAVQDFPEMADLLVEHGAELPGDLFSYAHTVAGYQWLQKHGIDLHARDARGRNLLSRALTRGGNVESVRFLVDQGLELDGVNQKGDSERTPLQHAVYASGMDAWPAIELLLPRLELSAQDKADLADAADDSKTREALAEKLGVGSGPPEPFDPDSIMSPRARTHDEKLRARIAALDLELQGPEPQLATEIRDYLDKGVTRVTVDRMRDELVSAFRSWSSPELDQVLAAVVFEWAGRSTEPYDTHAMMSGFGACTLGADRVELSSPVFDARGDIDFSCVLGVFEDMASEIAGTDSKTRATLQEYLTLHVASLLTIALGLAVESHEFAAVLSSSPTAFFVREHDHDPTLAFVFADDQETHIDERDS